MHTDSVNELHLHCTFVQQMEQAKPWSLDGQLQQRCVTISASLIAFESIEIGNTTDKSKKIK